MRRWELEEVEEQTAFRREFRQWLAEALGRDWMDAVDSGDVERFEKVKTTSGWNFLTWMGTMGRTPYAAPLWPKEYGGLSGEAWIVSRCAYPGCQQGWTGR
ncbi:MAG: hypothetical protein M1420_01560 [Actinobacteria bacterium]|jgi:alkylation response protein AidB-like acyl-CoA dehydrogenase|nr:hypothetical protein [Actinomycetota bacterium]